MSLTFSLYTIDCKGTLFIAFRFTKLSLLAQEPIPTCYRDEQSDCATVKTKDWTALNCYRTQVLGPNL